MSPFIRFAGFCVMAASCLGLQASDPFQKWIPLFDGNSLQGWDGRPGAWVAQDGEIRTTGQPDGRNWLIWRGEAPEDFILRLEYRHIRGNSGVQVRSLELKDHQVRGYQVEVAEPAVMGLWHHSLMTEKDPAIQARKTLSTAGLHTTIHPSGVRSESRWAEAGELQKAVHAQGWNEMEIRVQGNLLSQSVNGVLLSQLVDRERAFRTRQGVIALQDHGKGCQVAFRNLRLLPLPPSDPPANHPLWTGPAPKETSMDPGKALPGRPTDTKPITRVTEIRRPSIDVFLPEGGGNGTGVLIIPGGGFRYVVTDLEGSEAAGWLNDLGMAAFVLRHRTSDGKPEEEALWLRPLQDAQRAMQLIRQRAREFGVKPDRIGVLGFSAGGQVASVLMTAQGAPSYPASKDDPVGAHSWHPDFNLLVYPWRVQDPSTGKLLEAIQVHDQCRPSFIVHTHDDRSSSAGAALLFLGLKQAKVPAELHVYQNGGHGYGIRPREGSVIHTWTDRATDWLMGGGWTQP